MIPIKYILSVLLCIPLLPISTPAAFIVSLWTRPDDIDWGGWFGTSAKVVGQMNQTHRKQNEYKQFT